MSRTKSANYGDKVAALYWATYDGLSERQQNHIDSMVEEIVDTCPGIGFITAREVLLAVSVHVARVWEPEEED
jgi:hypothetical protein